MNIQEMLQKMLDLRASDLHLTANSPTLYRVDGRLVPISTERLGAEEVLRLAYSIMNETQRKTFEQNKEVDFSFAVQNLARFRSNVFLQRGCCTAAIRQIPFQIRTIEELGCRL